MPDLHTAEKSTAELPEQDKARIRAEMRYASLVVQELRPEAIQKSQFDKVLSVLSNGFVLLLIGSAITAGLVPYFQRDFEVKRQRVATMQECLAQFLLYGNSIWQEYYAILPLTQQQEIDMDEYLRYVKEITQVKLKRYDAFAKVEALAVVFQADANDKHMPVGKVLKDYAIKVNAASAAIDSWLTALYCTPLKRDKSPCATFDPTFDAFRGYTQIKQLVVDIGNEGTEGVAALMVRRINSF
jgi:hypothetical protein